MKVKTKSQLKELTNSQLISYLDGLNQSTFNGFVDADTKVRYFIAKYGEIFMREIKGTGLFFSAVIPQTMFESGYGRSNIFMNGNNFGGVRYNSNIHPAFHQSSSGKWAKWATAEEGVKGYVRVLLNKRYENARKNASSPEQQIVMIHDAGYDPSTSSSTYLNRVKGNIQRVRKLVPIGRIE